MTYAVKLVWADPELPTSPQLESVKEAVQQQIDQDFAPAWGCRATVEIEEYDPQGQPHGYPVLIKRDFSRDPEEEGFHFFTTAYPYAFVHYDGEDGDWPITVSHEILEMLADPTGSQTRSGPHPTRPGRAPDVDYLLEVCDPCQNTAFAYDKRGIRVSDFVTPAWYYGNTEDGPFSHTGRVTQPRQLLTLGYVTFFERPSGRMMQWFGHGEPQAAIQPPTGAWPYREWVDQRLDVPKPTDARNPRLAARVGP
jgi:hypothetical protein